MNKLVLKCLIATAVLVGTETGGYAQFGTGGPGSIGGVGGLGGAPPRQGIGPPRLTRNRSPILSPALNMLPGAVDNFTGQFLLRTVPQEQFYNNVQRNDRSLQGLQREITDDRNRLKSGAAEIQSGLSSTGKRVRFMNTGSYFPGNR